MANDGNLGEHLEAFVAHLVKSGRFSSRDEVLRDAVRLVQEREQRLAGLDQAIAAGLASARSGRLLDANAVFDELDERYAEPRLDSDAA